MGAAPLQFETDTDGRRTGPQRIVDSHSSYSSFRENVLEHVFVGDCLRRLWVRGIRDAEVLKAEVDAAGYDLVMDVAGTLRHIQLKASFNGSRVRRQAIHRSLAEKPSGCVLWLGFDPETLALGPFYWLGGQPGEPLPGIEGFKKARHTKGDATGHKSERRNSHVVGRAAFERLDTLDEVIERLFGSLGD